MNLTSKSRYALKIMMDLARYGASQPLVRRSEIVGRQGVPTDYLDQIMIKLRAGGLVESTRGRSGGYRLARSPESITMWDLFSTVEESMIPVECIASGHVCDFETSCASREAWGSIFLALKSSLGAITLAKLATDWAKEQPIVELTASEGLAESDALMGSRVRECRGGGRAECQNHAKSSDCGRSGLDG